MNLDPFFDGFLLILNAVVSIQTNDEMMEFLGFATFCMTGICGILGLILLANIIEKWSLR